MLENPVGGVYRVRDLGLELDGRPTAVKPLNSRLKVRIRHHHQRVPVRDILAQSIDFERLAGAPIKVFVTATDVRTGRGRVFPNGEITPDVMDRARSELGLEGM